MAVLLVLGPHYFTGVLPSDIGPLAGIMRDIIAPFFLSGVDLYFCMFHQAINGMVHGFGFGQAPRIHSWPEFVATCGSAIIAFALSYASTRYLETPIRRYGYRLTAAPATAPEGPATQHLRAG